MITRILINDFSEYIKVADKIRPTYYKQGNIRIPKMYQKVNFIFKERKLYDTKTNLFVLSNKNKVGKPKFYKINGQDLYNGRMHHSARAKVVSELHNYFAPYVAQLPVFTKYPIEISMNFRVKDEGKHSIDNDNKWLWQKAFTDTLTQEGKIVDDSPQYVSSHTLQTLLIDKDNTDQEPRLIIDIIDGDGRSN